jgi:hypothetical protein
MQTSDYCLIVSRKMPVINDDWSLWAFDLEESIAIIKQLGPPCFLDIDSNIGLNDSKEDTSKDVVRYLRQHFFDCNIEYRIRNANSPNGIWLHSFLLSWRQIKGFHSNGKYY